MMPALLLAPVELLALGELLIEPLSSISGREQLKVLLAHNVVYISTTIRWPNDQLIISVRITFDGLVVTTSVYPREPYIELEINDPEVV